MPSVADELAELRARNVTKQHAASLESKSTGSGGALSTPEAEEAALKAKKERERVGNYSKDAQANLKAGVKDVGLTDEFRRKVGDKKREDRNKKVEAERNLNEFNLKGKGTTSAKASVAAAAGPAIPVTKPPAPAPAPAAAASVAPATAEPAATPAEVVDDDGDDDDVPELEEAVPELSAADDAVVAEAEAAAAAQQGVDDGGKPVPNRAEKKARKMMARLGMRPLQGIARVTLKTAGRGGYFAIERPDVYVSGGGEKNAAYVIFGEARQGGGMGQQQQQAQRMEQMRQAQAAMEAAAPQAKAEEAAPAAAASPAAPEEGGEEAAVDETGVEAKDIELVMSQASCSRAKAVAALRENDGDLVNAIMSLTT